MAIKVKLRQKEISGNRQSLYLDFYPAIINPETGEPTRREFLKIYLFGKLNKKGDLDPNIKKKQNPFDKIHDENAINKAKVILNQRENNLNKPEIYTAYEKEQLRIKDLGQKNFIEYFNTLANKRKASNHDNWISAFKYLEAFTNGNLKFADLNESFCNDFKEHLLSTKSTKSSKATLAQNSAVSYFNKFKASLKQAYKEGYLNTDLNAKIEGIEAVEVIKNTLTIEELNTIAKTDFENQLCKKVVLFSALTGMPFMEMKNLKWGQIETSETFGFRVKMIRQKTNKPYHINISEQAYQLLGKPNEPNKAVFEGLNNQLRYFDFKILLTKAGINKEMTFHDLRHTYGCLQIDLGTDIYTLQGNMGHSTPRQSMHYGKISDQRKRNAAEKIKLEF